MKIPVAQIFPLRNRRNTGGGIFRSKSRVEILQPFQWKESQPKHFKEIIQKEKQGYKDHVGDLQFQKPVKCFLDIRAWGYPAQCIEQSDIKNQRKYPDFRKNVKLSGPECRMDKYNGKGRQSFCEINIEVSFHCMDMNIQK